MKLLIILFLFIISIYPQKTETGGKFLPANGNVHILFIFAQFPDDKYSPDGSNWKLNSPPDYISDFVNGDKSNISHNGNLSCYFDDMSRHQFQLTGKTIFLTTSRTRKWYFENKKSRYDINKDLIQESDKSIEFSEFDRWKKVKNYDFEEKPDGIVDMIIVIFRNVANDMPDSIKTKMENQFGLVPGGEASLGYGPSFNVDDNKRIINTGYPGSGLNVKANLSINAISGCAHEFGHYLLGGNEVHFTSGMYGLMSSWGFTQRSIMMNGWERFKLGWVNLIEIGPEKGIFPNVEIRDYISSGDLVKINAPGSKEYFLLENHQIINKFWDIPDQSGTDIKGIYVLRQSGNSGSSVSLICADGRWVWEVKNKVSNPYGGKDSLPVFTKVKEDEINGRFDSDMIPYKYNGKPGNDVIHFYKNSEDGEIHESAVFRGDGTDKFTLEKNTFSSETNPSSILSNKKPSGVSFVIKSSANEKEYGGEKYLLDIVIK